MVRASDERFGGRGFDFYRELIKVVLEVPSTVAMRPSIT